MLDILCTSLSCAIIAFVYSYLLTRDGEILRGVYLFLKKHLIKKTIVKAYDNGEYIEVEKEEESILFKPLISCEKCVAGQIAMWYGVFMLRPYNFFTHVLLICASIFITVIIKKLYEKI